MLGISSSVDFKRFIALVSISSDGAGGFADRLGHELMKDGGFLIKRVPYTRDSLYGLVTFVLTSYNAPTSKADMIIHIDCHDAALYDSQFERGADRRLKPLVKVLGSHVVETAALCGETASVERFAGMEEGRLMGILEEVREKVGRKLTLDPVIKELKEMNIERAEIKERIRRLMQHIENNVVVIMVDVPQRMESVESDAVECSMLISRLRDYYSRRH